MESLPRDKWVTVKMESHTALGVVNEVNARRRDTSNGVPFETLKVDIRPADKEGWIQMKRID